MYDIITFGSGTRDVYVRCKEFLPVAEKKFVTGNGICISLGSKIEVDELAFHTGGGATNAAATFKKQGFNVAWCGTIGDDVGGKEIIKRLKGFGIDTSLVFISRRKPTNYSVVLCPEDKSERTILVYHGASSAMVKEDFPWKKLKANWFYIAPLSGKSAKVFNPLVELASSRGIKIAANPGNTQLKLPETQLYRALKGVDVLILNKEEAALLCKMPYNNEKKLIKKTQSLTGKIVAITNGPGGAFASDGKCVYYAPIQKAKVVDRVGAGDAFGAGFVSEFMRTNDIVSSLQFGIANSAACISKRGAKEGLLGKNTRWRRVKVAKSPL